MWQVSYGPVIVIVHQYNCNGPTSAFFVTFFPRCTCTRISFDSDFEVLIFCPPIDCCSGKAEVSVRCYMYYGVLFTYKLATIDLVECISYPEVSLIITIVLPV